MAKGITLLYPTLDKYTVFKTSLVYEEYLDLLPRRLRLFFVRLRVSAHPLRIQTGRYAQNNTPRNELYFSAYQREREVQ